MKYLLLLTDNFLADTLMYVMCNAINNINTYRLHACMATQLSGLNVYLYSLYVISTQGTSGNITDIEHTFDV